MASITVRNLDDDLKRRLRIRAATNNNSMEQEVRDILKAAVGQEQPIGDDLVEALRWCFEPLGEVELDLPSRKSIREPPTFD